MIKTQIKTKAKEREKFLQGKPDGRKGSVEKLSNVEKAIRAADAKRAEFLSSQSDADDSHKL